MTHIPAPLFFPEALQDIKRLTPRLRALSFTLEDLAWLRNVELASHTQRLAQRSPMTVDSIQVRTGTAEPVPLVGSFIMHSTPGDHGAVLYTPYGGLLKFDDVSALLQALNDTLLDPRARVDLISLLPIDQRNTLPIAPPFTLTQHVIEGPVFDHQLEALDQSQRRNVTLMLDQLNQLPTLTTMVNQLFNSTLATHLPAMDQRNTRVSYWPAPATIEAGPTPPPEPEPLVDAILRAYRHQARPLTLVRQFSNPQYATSTHDPEHQQRWENAFTYISANLPSLLVYLLQTYWAAHTGSGVSRRRLFAQAMSDKARMDLLRKRQSAIISPKQSRRLAALLDLDHRPSAVQAQKIHLWEYRERFVELAASLMLMEDSTAYLYTQPKGFQVLKNTEDVKQVLSTMATARGHDDELYSLLTLAERDVFLGFDQPDVSGALITGPVFQDLTDAIIAKQKDNIAYALQTWRNSDAAFDIRTLFDQALDVRSLFDNQLFNVDSGTRWSPRAPGPATHRPSIVLAMKAALSIKTFQSVQAAFDRKLVTDASIGAEQQRTFLESIKPQLAHAMSVGIRGEATLRMLTQTLHADEKAIVDSALNPDKPTPAQRSKVNGFRPDAWSLTLECPQVSGVIPLANCFLLTERGGLDAATSGRAILWTPGAGLESFSSIDRIKDQLRRRLEDPVKRLVFLENIPRTQFRPHRAYTLGSFRLIERNLLQDRQQSAIEQYLEARQYRRSLTAPDTQALPDLEPLTQIPTSLNLQWATQIAQAIITQQALPTWLGVAPHPEVQRHAELLEQYRNSIAHGKDYLHGIPPFTDYVHQQLRTLLLSRFPDVDLDRQQIYLTPSLEPGAPAQTLIEFALSPLHATQGMDFDITSTRALPAGLNLQAVRNLIQRLDIQTAYQQYLTDNLASTAPDVASRQQRFIQQLPWQLLIHAHALKLQGQLSERGLTLLEHVLDMPEPLARATVTGANAIVRPLELMPIEGTTTAPTLGLYLIGEQASGPQILYAPYGHGLELKEYENEAQLISAINQRGALQDLVIQRLPALLQSAYRNQLTGSTEASVRLACNAFKGNLLHQLFKDNTALLSRMLGSQSDPGSQDDWDVLKALFAKGVTFGTRFLPAKLTIPLILWQSYTSFKDSAEALQDHHWKTALYTFINGVAQLAMVGKLLHEPDATARERPTVDVTAPARTQLQPFEASDVTLSPTKAADGTFRDTQTAHHYVPVEGKVYRIDRRQVAPRIVNDHQHGPYVQNTGTQWTRDPEVHTVHFGKAMSTLHSRHQPRTPALVREFLNVEARGMHAIRRLYPQRARQIIQALDLARFYAFNSLHNLALMKDNISGSRLEPFFKTFFDVEDIDEALLKKIKAAIVPVCLALVDPTLDRLDHDRFVVGSARLDVDSLIAFVVNDAQQTVHFTENFFNQQLSEYDNALTQPFDVLTHAQAATLIHEFTHLFANTFDIASLESRRPFTDLISTSTSHHRDLKQQQGTFQRNALSLQTPSEELFARWNQAQGAWEDFEEVAGTRTLRNAIQSATGTRSLEAARQAFLDPASPIRRIDTILRNADSVTSLICEMGRRLDSPQTPV